MFSCISDDVDWAGEGSHGDERNALQALQLKCSRLSKLLEETEVQRWRDRKAAERELRAAQTACDVQLERVTVQRSSDISKATTALQHRLAVTESEIIYWRSKCERLQDSSCSQYQSDVSQPARGAVSPFPRLVASSRSTDFAEPQQPFVSAEDVAQQRELVNNSMTSKVFGDDDSESIQQHLVQAHKEAIDVLRLQHHRHCMKLQDRLSKASSEVSALNNEVRGLKSLLESAEGISSSLRVELRELQQRLHGVVVTRESVEEKVQSVLAENRSLLDRLNRAEIKGEYSNTERENLAHDLPVCAAEVRYYKGCTPRQYTFTTTHNQHKNKAHSSHKSEKATNEVVALNGALPKNDLENLDAPQVLKSPSADGVLISKSAQRPQCHGPGQEQAESVLCKRGCT